MTTYKLALSHDRDGNVLELNFNKNLDTLTRMRGEAMSRGGRVVLYPQEHINITYPTPLSDPVSKDGNTLGSWFREELAEDITHEYGPIRKFAVAFWPYPTENPRWEIVTHITKQCQLDQLFDIAEERGCCVGWYPLDRFKATGCLDWIYLETGLSKQA